MVDDDSSAIELPAGYTLLLSIEETAAQLRIGRTRTYELVMSGQIRSVTIGRRRLVPRESLVEFVRRLASQ
jgi:excisionase family DNA binding protein